MNNFKNMYDENGILKPEYERALYLLLNMYLSVNDMNNDKREIDPYTDFGKGITFKSVDGKDWASYEDAMAYNQMYYESMIISNKDKGMRETAEKVVK